MDIVKEPVQVTNTIIVPCSKFSAKDKDICISIENKKNRIKVAIRQFCSEAVGLWPGRLECAFTFDDFCNEMAKLIKEKNKKRGQR